MNFDFTEEQTLFADSVRKFAQAQLAKVKVGQFSSVSDAGIYVAMEKKFFAEQGIEVELAKVDSGATMVTELANGNLDVSGGSPGAGLYNAVRQGIAMKIVADKGSTLPGHGYFAFLVRKDLADKIRTVQDFRGRTLVVTGHMRGASSEVTIGKLLAGAGMKESDLKLVNMTFPDIIAALGTGRADIGVVAEPLVTQAIDKGIVVVAVDQGVTQEGTYLLSNDQVQYGYLGAKWLFDKLGGKGTVYYMRGLAGHPADTDRHIGFEQALGVDAGVTLRRRQRGVTEQLLNRPQIAAARQKVRGKGVAQGVGRRCIR